MAESILQEAERLISADRHAEYGSAQESFDAIAKGWTEILGSVVSGRQVALCMIWLKVMREKAGDKRDNWVDMAGYAGLGGILNG